jgi:hypothetical protein
MVPKKEIRRKNEWFVFRLHKNVPQEFPRYRFLVSHNQPLGILKSPSTKPTLNNKIYCERGKEVKKERRKGKERKGKERKGKERKGKERKGKERKGKERKGKEKKGKERKGKERKGKERKGKERWKGGKERKGDCVPYFPIQKRLFGKVGIKAIFQLNF